MRCNRCPEMNDLTDNIHTHTPTVIDALTSADIFLHLADKHPDCCGGCALLKKCHAALHLSPPVTPAFLDKRHRAIRGIKRRCVSLCVSVCLCEQMSH